MSFDFVSHLEELRRRLILWILSFCLAAIVSYFFSHQILDILIQPLRQMDKSTELFFQKPYEAFLIHIKVAALAGAIFSSPVFFSQMWLFVSPGLYENEKKFILPLIFISVLLFLIGILFAYTMVIPWGLGFFLSFQTETLKPMINVNSYFSFLNGMLFAFGLLFDFPVLVTGLSALGIIHTSTLRSARKPIIVIIFVLAAVLTPSPDPVSQLMLAIPLVFLFEISVLISRGIEKRRDRNQGIDSSGRG